MTARYVHLTGPWPAAHYATMTLARAASIAAGTTDTFTVTEAGTYTAENWAAQIPAGGAMSASVAGVVMSWTAGLNPLWLPHNNETLTGMGLAFDASHVYGIKVVGKTGILIKDCAFVPLSVGSADNRAFCDVMSNGSVTIDNLTISGDSGNGYVMVFSQGDTGVTIRNIRDLDRKWYRWVYNYSGAHTTTVSNIRALAHTDAVIFATGGTATLDLVDSPSAVTALRTQGAASVAAAVTRCYTPSALAWQASTGALSGSLQNNVTATLLNVTAGASTATGDHNSYVSTMAGSGTGDKVVVAASDWRLDTNTRVPYPGSPLLLAGAELAGKDTDLHGNPSRSGGRMDIGPVQRQKTSPRRSGPVQVRNPRRDTRWTTW